MADTEKPRSKAAAAAGKGSGQRPLPTLPANMKTLNNLEFKWSAIDASKLGIWSLGPIPEGTKFGPFQGEKVVTLKKDSDPLCIWEIVDLDTKEFLFYCDGTKLDEANWLRHVQCARFYEEQNILAEQDGIDIMYTTIKPISKGEELLTWYKVPTTRRGQRQAGRESRGKAKSIKDMPSMSLVPKSPGPKGSPTSSCTSPKKKPTKVVKSPRTASPLSKPAEINESPKKEESLKKEEIHNKKEKASKKDSPKKDESCKKEEILKRKESPKKEENSKKEEIPKKEETPKRKDTPKKEDSSKKEEITKRKDTPKKEDSSKKEEITKKQETPQKKEILKKEETPQKKDTPKKEESSKKEESPKKQETPQKKEMPKKKEETSQQKEESPKKQLPKREELSKKEETLRKKESPKKGEFEEEAQSVDDRERDSSDLEMDLDDAEGDEDDDDDELDSDGNFSKGEGSKSTQSEDPEKFHFKLKKAHVTKSRHGRKVFKCDICSGIYRHAFSLKRHYIRNHINLKYVSRGDILNCQINPETHDLGTWYSVMDGDSPGPGPTNEKDSDKGSTGTDSKTVEKDFGNDSGSTPPRLTCDNKTSIEAGTSKSVLQREGFQPVDLPGSPGQNGESKKEDDDDIEKESNDSLIERDLSGLYRCNVCSSCFDTVALLKCHLDNHPNLPSSKAFACDQCDMKFAHKQNLRRHLAVHTGEKPFLCKFCGKMFPTATNQKRHERIHLGRRVACEYCSSTFTQSGDLKKHIRKLHPECFHECAFCGKYFTDEDELIEHVVTHNESMQSNEAERHRRRHAFKVDMELDRIESMKLAEQKTPGVKFACTVCKKRFLDYANMCRHRRLAHQRHLLLGINGSNSSSPVPSPTKLASDSSDGDPQAFFYANVANNISENLTNYLEGTKEHLDKTANQLKLHNQIKDSTEKVNAITPKVEADHKDVSYNFPSDFCFKQNYRKVVPDKDKTFDMTKKVKAASNVSDLADLNKPLDSKTSTPPGPCSSDLSKSVKVTEVKATEVRNVKVTEPKVDKVNKEEIEVKPVIASMVNGVSLNIPVFNLSNMTAKREIKIQPVCTVQPIQRQSPAVSEQKTVETAAAVVPAKKSVVAANSDKPSVVPSVSSPIVNKTVVSHVNGTPPPPPVAAAVKLVTKSPAKTVGNKTSPVGGNKASSASSSCLALKIPEVHVCSVCRRLFNNEAIFRKHMLDKHKTTPEQSAAQKEQREKSSAAEISLEGSEPVMDLSGKIVPPVSKPSEAPAEKEKAIIDHDEGARLLLDFALGIRDEPKETSIVESPKSTEEHFPLDLSGGLSSDSKSHNKKRTKNQQPKGNHSGTTIHPKAGPATPDVGHCGRVPAAHTGSLNQQGKVQGLLRIPTYHSTKDLDLPAPLASPPGTPRSPWQPQLPISALFGSGPFTKHTTGRASGNKKFICTVCYGEFPSRGSLHNHQRATHTNVRCDHVEVDTDVVAPWWQKPSPVGMLNVCSSQMSEYNQADQEQFKCTKCQKSFKAVEELHGHIFECATPLLKPTTKPKLTLLPTPKTVPMSRPAVCDDSDAAAVAAAGLRLLAAASQPRLPLRDHLPATAPRPFSVPRLNPGSTAVASTITTGSITGSISSPAASTTTAPTASMLERFKNSFLKKMKKKKKKREQEDSFGLLTKKRRRSLELLYNPQNHVRRREMTEVVDMQRCQGCGQRFTTISLLERHIPVCTHKDRLKDIKVIRNPLDTLGDQAESRNLCHYCSRQFTYAGMLRKHVFEVCPVRRTRVAEARPLDVTWEQELAQHYSGPASIDTCSNDGSHVDDTASIATSTSSSHDADQRTRRRKRKNRGWGNGKKKRTLSNVDLPAGFNSDEMWSPDSGTPAPAEDEDDDIDDDLEDGSVSDVEVKKEDKIKTELSTDLGESSQSGDELKIVEDAVVEDREVPSLVSNMSAIKSDVTLVKSEPKMTPISEPQVAVKSEPQIKSEPSPIIPPVTKCAPPREISPKPNSFVGRHTLPFVLSIPQYRERTPLTTKPKPSKPLITTANGSVTVTQKPHTSPENKASIEVSKALPGPIKPVPSEGTKSVPSEKPNTSTVFPVVSQVGAAVLTASCHKDKKDIVSAEKGISSIIRNVEISATRPKTVHISPVSALVCKPPLTSQTFPLNKTLTVSNSVTCPTARLGLVLDKATPANSGFDSPSAIRVEEQNRNQVYTSATNSEMPDTMLKTVVFSSAAPGKQSNVILTQAPKVDAAVKISIENPNVQQGNVNNFTKVVGENLSERQEPVTPLDKPSEVEKSDKIETTTSLVEASVTATIVDKGVSVQDVIVRSDDYQDVTNNSCSPSGEQKLPQVKLDQALSVAVDEDSDETSDEEDIKEIINTVLAQTRMGQKPKTPKPKKQKKAELKKSTVAEKPAKAVKTNNVKNTLSKVTPEATEKKSKQTKSKADKDGTPKTSKTKTKKKTPVENSPKQVAKSNLSGKKEEEKSTLDVSNSEGPKPSPKKNKKKTNKDALKDEPPKKKKKSTEKETGEKGTPKKDPNNANKVNPANKINTTSKTPKEKTKKAKQVSIVENASKKTNNSDSPTKNATHSDSPTKKATNPDSPTKKATNLDSPTKKATNPDSPTKKATNLDTPTKKATNPDSPTKKATNLASPTKKAANSDSPKKVPNKSKPKSTLKKAQCDDNQSDKKDSPSPVKNRKRKVTADPSSSPLTPSGKDSPRKTPGDPSPAKLMKTRGGPVAGPISPTSDNEAKKDASPTVAGKARRVSIRGNRPSASDSADQGSDTKGKGGIVRKSLLSKSLLSKTVLPKLKRSISASAAKKPALGDKAGKARGPLNGATSMRTRQSRLSV